jgi:hypothetical protein
VRATIVDLRYHMNDILKALDRNEDVDILYRGKSRGVLVAKVERVEGKVTDHPFFNMRGGERSVETEMEELRGGRYRKRDAPVHE